MFGGALLFKKVLGLLAVFFFFFFLIARLFRRAFVLAALFSFLNVRALVSDSE